MYTDVATTQAAPFDALRQVRADGTEFWAARDLMPILGYDRWENFTAAVARAHASAVAQGHDVNTLSVASRKRVQAAPSRTSNSRASPATSSR